MEDADHEALWLAFLIKVQFWINRVASFIVFQPMDPDTGAPLHEEREIAVRQELNVLFEFYLWNVTGGPLDGATPFGVNLNGDTSCGSDWIVGDSFPLSDQRR